MSRYLQAEHGGGASPSRAISTVHARVAVALLALALAPGLQAQGKQAQHAIERLEGCGKQERRQECVKILKKKPGVGGRQKIKAQVRGQRIIWYEFDPDTGKVRRTN